MIASKITYQNTDQRYVFLTNSLIFSIIMTIVLGFISYFGIIEKLPSWISIIAMFLVFKLAYRQIYLKNRFLIFSGYLFTLNLLVTKSFFDLYTIKIQSILYLLGLVSVYIFTISIIMTFTFPSKLSLIQILFFASSITLFDRFISDSNIFYNYAIPMIHNYYLFTPEIFGLYAQFNMYGAVFIIYVLLLFLIKMFYEFKIVKKIVFGIFIVLFILLSNFISSQKSSKNLFINLIQPGIISDERHLIQDSKSYIKKVLKSEFKLNLLNILPESSVFNYNFNKDELNLLSYDNLLFGGMIHNQDLIYNSINLLQKGKVKSQYNKIFLVPGDEDQWIQAGNIHQTNTISFENTILGTGICYEGAFQKMGMNGVQNGATMFIVVSNTQGKLATALQLRGIKVRAAETGRAFVFAAMAGQSSLIDPQGRTIQKMPWAKSASQVMSVPLYTKLTTASTQTRWIDFFILIIFCIVTLKRIQFRSGNT